MTQNYNEPCTLYAADWLTLSQLLDSVQFSLLQRWHGSSKRWSFTVVDKHDMPIVSCSECLLGEAMATVTAKLQSYIEAHPVLPNQSFY